MVIGTQLLWNEEKLHLLDVWFIKSGYDLVENLYFIKQLKFVDHIYLQKIIRVTKNGVFMLDNFYINMYLPFQ